MPGSPFDTEPLFCFDQVMVLKKKELTRQKRQQLLMSLFQRALQVTVTDAPRAPRFLGFGSLVVLPGGAGKGKKKKKKTNCLCPCAPVLSWESANEQSLRCLLSSLVRGSFVYQRALQHVGPPLQPVSYYFKVDGAETQGF